jgi:hypothetical protein
MSSLRTTTEVVFLRPGKIYNLAAIKIIIISRSNIVKQIAYPFTIPNLCYINFFLTHWMSLSQSS